MLSNVAKVILYAGISSRHSNERDRTRIDRICKGSFLIPSLIVCQWFCIVPTSFIKSPRIYLPRGKHLTLMCVLVSLENVNIMCKADYIKKCFNYTISYY